MEIITERYYVAVWFKVDRTFDYFIYHGKLETADDIENARQEAGEGAVIIWWKRIE